MRLSSRNFVGCGFGRCCSSWKHIVRKLEIGGRCHGLNWQERTDGEAPKEFAFDQLFFILVFTISFIFSSNSWNNVVKKQDYVRLQMPWRQKSFYFLKKCVKTLNFWKNNSVQDFFLVGGFLFPNCCVNRQLRIKVVLISACLVNPI